MIRVLLIILISSSLSFSQSGSVLKKIERYTIVSENNTIDTILNFEYEYDSLGRKLMERNNKYWQGEFQKTKYFYYGMDTIMETVVLNERDTLTVKKTITSDTTSNQSEMRYFGYLTDGEYLKSDYHVVRKGFSNLETQTGETILYSERGDTSYHIISETISSEVPFYSITNKRDKMTGKFISKYILQSDEEIEETKDCYENCSKRIFFRSDSIMVNKLDYSGSIYTENGDTTKMVIEYKTLLPNGKTCITKERHSYEQGKSNKELNYFEKDQFYLREIYGWVNDKWTLTETEEREFLLDELYITKEFKFKEGNKELISVSEINWNEDKTEKLTQTIEYKSGGKERMTRKFDRYTYW